MKAMAHLFTYTEFKHTILRILNIKDTRTQN
jgi:hypothetical protein